MKLSLKNNNYFSILFYYQWFFNINRFKNEYKKKNENEQQVKEEKETF